jgi:hypothetical protein
MSYSFNVKAATKAEAKAAVAAKFDEVVALQPVHAKDRDAALANAGALIDLLADDENRDVSVGCSGYVAWSGADGEEQISTASASSTASLTNRD